jgi:transcriptional regulator with GAF, ATPase, and Fis domain
MRDFSRFLLEIWKESCQHTDLAALVAELAPRLAAHLPIGAIYVRELVPARRSIETIAYQVLIGDRDIPDSPVTLSTGDWKRVAAWAKSDWLENAADPPSQVAAGSPQGGWLAIPLFERRDVAGVLVLTAKPRTAFNRKHREMVAQLADPLAAALALHRKHRELATQRDSAAADRASLLTRLGRKEMLEAIIGADKGLRLVMERVELVAPADAPVLILGETGSGKEVIARAIHERSPRSAGPFIRVNCGAIPPELIDSQLFGHEKGSFTGASDQRQGWFERADGGTLFLDEIGELPLPAQVRLLRVLQDHHFERVGGQQAVHVDVRIVAATHRELAEMVARGNFRQDLWYRINVFPILLPQLSERTEDIPDLARHFARRAATRFGLAYVEPSAGDLLLLESYGWPGNVRELSAVIDRATILGRGKSLDVATALGWSNQGRKSTATAPESSASKSTASPVIAATPLGVLSLNAAIAQHIERALAVTCGRIEGRKGAAALLAINPHTLRAKMRKLGIDWTRYRD